MNNVIERLIFEHTVLNMTGNKKVIILTNNCTHKMILGSTVEGHEHLHFVVATRVGQATFQILPNWTPKQTHQVPTGYAQFRGRDAGSCGVELGSKRANRSSCVELRQKKGGKVLNHSRRYGEFGKRHL